MNVNHGVGSKMILGFMIGFIVPWACAYGIYLDFGSVSAAVLAGLSSSLTLLMIGNVYSSIIDLQNMIKLRMK